jgi:Fur family ferric uptake transcriptional regulator
MDEILKKGLERVASLDKATVYRNLKHLVDDGRLKRFNHPTQGTLYERTGKGHHHHFHCRACNRAFEVPGCALKAEQSVPEGFVLEGHDVFFSGLCPDCGIAR